MIGSGTLNAAGQATLTTSALTVATHAITAVYGGDTNFTTSSGSLSQVVGHANTSVSLTASANPATVGAYVLFTATVVVTAPGGGTPSGTVTFTDGSTRLGIVSVVAANGQITAKLQTNTLSAGTHSIVATYSGSSGYAGSVSTTYVETINSSQTATAVALGSSVNPSTLGQNVTLTATVTSSAGTPSGSVTFYDGSTVLGSGNLSAGVASLSTTGLSVGTHALTAVYSGSTSYAGSTSAMVNEVVNPLTTTTTLQASPAPCFLRPIGHVVGNGCFR